MRKKTLWVTGAASAAVVLGGASLAFAASQQSRDVQPWGGNPLVVKVGDIDGDDGDSGSTQPLSDADRDKATSAALAKVGQGTVIEVERDDDGGSVYEVEVRLDNGSEVDVELAADFQVLNTGDTERD